MILVSFGTRPEWIKIKPVVEAMKGKISYRLLFTGQHTDLLSDVDSQVIKLDMKRGINRLDSIVQSIMNQERVFSGVSSVLVQGDTSSAFAVALAAFHRKLNLIHLEAGLRTFSRNPYPEEFNRRSISCMANLHLCPTKESGLNLLAEKVNGDIRVVGNTALDNLNGVPVSYDNSVLITLHRRENHDLVKQWFKSFEELAQKYPDYSFTLPIHPNPNVQKYRDLLQSVKVLEPMPHEDFVTKMAKSKLLITDSGGLQEEGAFLRKKCIVCRDETERPEGLGNFSFLANPDNIEHVFQQVLERPVPTGECPYGDGKSSSKIIKILESCQYV